MSGVVRRREQLHQRVGRRRVDPVLAAAAGDGMVVDAAESRPRIERARGEAA